MSASAVTPALIDTCAHVHTHVHKRSITSHAHKHTTNINRLSYHSCKARSESWQKPGDSLYTLEGSWKEIFDFVVCHAIGYFCSSPPNSFNCEWEWVFGSSSVLSQLPRRSQPISHLRHHHYHHHQCQHEPPPPPLLTYLFLLSDHRR